MSEQQGAGVQGDGLEQARGVAMIAGNVPAVVSGCDASAWTVARLAWLASREAEQRWPEIVTTLGLDRMGRASEE